MAEGVGLTMGQPALNCAVLGHWPCSCVVSSCGEAAFTTASRPPARWDLPRRMSVWQNESSKARSPSALQVTVGQREEMFLDRETSHVVNQVLKYVRNNVLFKN